ncbi:MAG: DsbA family protein [Alphaproteobacteria bacterium]|nr:DsbA family protein [Alphaproteobacteria bacterium]
MTPTRRSLLLTAAATATLGLPALPALAQSVDTDKLMKVGPLGEMALGDEKAPVTIVEYASATCPHCANFHKGTFKELDEKYIKTGKVRFVFREFPFDNPSLAAFMVARCAPKDKYFPMIDVLFQQQRKWAVQGADVRGELFNIARLAGFTQKTFDECLKNEEVAKGVIAVRDMGTELGVTSTPSFFVNGVAMKGNNSLAQFEAMIKPHLSN